MTRTQLTKELRTFTGKGLITQTELSRFVGDKNVGRVAKKYLKGVPRIGKGYFIPDVAESMMQHIEIGGADEEDY